MRDARTSQNAGRLITGEELARVPGLGPCELVEGRIVPLTPPFAEHGRVETNIVVPLGAFVRTRNLGTVMCGDVGVYTRRNPDTVRGPDVLFLSRERDGRRVRRDHYLDVAPDLVVEILSPDNTRREIRQKLSEYFGIGVRLAWVVDPRKRTVHVHTSKEDARVLTEGDVLDCGEVLPGFTLPVAEVLE